MTVMGAFLMKQPLRNGLGWLLLLLLSIGQPLMAQSNGVSDSRYAVLTRGVNISRWFWLNDDRSDFYYQTYISDAQLAEIRATGFNHVRLPIDPAYLIEVSTLRVLPDPQMVDHIEQAIQRILAQDLAVIVDLHPLDDFKAQLMTDTGLQAAFEQLWEQLARRFSPLNPERVFLEVMNEPAPEDGSIWPPLQERFVNAMRRGAPQHTLIVGGVNFNSIDGLLALPLLSDRNLIYNFHFYDPFIFTHQGAFWLPTVGAVYNLPYPSTGGRCGTLPDFFNEQANQDAGWYCNNETWDFSRIETRIQQAAVWAQQNGVRITANEFGVYPSVSPPADRLQWFRDTRTILERYNIGWTVWGYDDIFGLGYTPDSPVMDAEVLAALNLTPASAVAVNPSPAPSIPVTPLAESTSLPTRPPVTLSAPADLESRYALLSSGVAIASWFAYNPDTREHFQSFMSDTQLVQLRSIGFRHIRLAVAPEALLDMNNPAIPNPAVLPYLQTAIDRILAADLAVILDIHPRTDSFKANLNQLEFSAAFEHFWEGLATTFRNVAPDRLFFEVMNQPAPEMPRGWWSLQGRVVSRIRAAAPNHTIIVTASDWSSPWTLAQMIPYPDANLIYTFDFYNPFAFTHQGASFSTTTAPLYNLPYPSTGGRCGSLPDFGSAQANKAAQDYCTIAPYDAAQMETDLQPVTAWGQEQDVLLLVGAFGVHVSAPSADRLQWFQDFRQTLALNGIGWTLWDYDGEFGLQYTAASQMPNPAVLSALGLAAP
jgi:endoglucanase